MNGLGTKAPPPVDWPREADPKLYDFYSEALLEPGFEGPEPDVVTCRHIAWHLTHNPGLRRQWRVVEALGRRARKVTTAWHVDCANGGSRRPSERPPLRRRCHLQLCGQNRRSPTRCGSLVGDDNLSPCSWIQGVSELPRKSRGVGEVKSLALRENHGPAMSGRGGRKSASPMTLARTQVSRQLSRRLPYYLTPEEAHHLIDAVENERDRLFVKLLWETGVRISEAIRTKLRDVSRDGIRVLGKGNVERVVFVQEGLVAAILFYAQEKELRRDDYLFPSRKGGHITKQRVDQIIKKAAGHAGLQRNVHAHLFRHGYAINFLNCGGRLDALQEQLGHRDINTTRIYLRLSDEDVKREVAKMQF